MSKAKLFLKARWENLVLASYKIDPDLLLEHLPRGLELDTIDGNAFISLVAFGFNDIRIKGFKIPFHVNFPEINLRFYVRESLTMRRGVVFVREFVPRTFVSFFANALYNENYMSAPMESKLGLSNGKIFCSYGIKYQGKSYNIRIVAENNSFLPSVNSTGHFFKEHQWGFGRTRKGDTLVYRVEHPFWEIYPITEFEHNVDFEIVYGDKWQFLNYEKPYNVIFAKGSEVKVYSAENVKREK